MTDVLSLLLNLGRQPMPEKQVKVKRLSKICGEDVVFCLRGVSYDRVAEIKEANEKEMAVVILLAGVTQPDLKNKELLEKYGAHSNDELVKKMLLPGEIEDLSMEVERLSGYRMATVEEIKKKSKPTTN